MKFFYIFFSIISSIYSQQEDALVYLVDKENVEQFINRPSMILSQRSIERKTRHNTPIDNRDVPVNETYISSLKSAVGIEVLAKSKWTNSVYVRGKLSDIQKLKNLQFVESVEFMDRAFNNSLTQKKIFSKHVGIYILRNYNYGSALNQTQMISLDNLHDEGFAGDGIYIAIMDSGFPNITENPAFATLISEERLLGTYDFVERSKNIRGTGVHGSETLSVMAGYRENEFIGTAPEASYYLFRTEFAPSENPVEEAWWIEALERADSLGVDIVNTSLGYRDFDKNSYNYSFEDLDGKTTISARGANIAFEKGLLIITSAGNDGQAEFNTISTPADASGVLAIGAVDPLGDYASFSSIGPTVDGRIKPDVMAQGMQTATLDTLGNLNFVNGTSFSSPIIAGATACLLGALPDLSNFQIMQLIQESGSAYNNPTSEMGYGIPNFETIYKSGLLLQSTKISIQNHFVIEENPVTNEVVFLLPESILYGDVWFFDLLGQQILKTQITKYMNHVDISQFDSGIYIAMITGGGKSNSFKIIKR